LHSFLDVNRLTIDGNGGWTLRDKPLVV